MAEQASADYRGNLGRYALHGEIASGGMATVHVARLLGHGGFNRTVAVKRLHPHLAKDPDFAAMFLEEARLAARIRHPNVVPTLDVVSDQGELFLVMEYVAGESLSRLVRKAREAGTPIPPRYVVSIMAGALDGLHAAHEARSEHGDLLGLVHRDVSPQNIHVGVDGVARVLDFGIAKATNRVQETRTDQIKGKIAYMSPEQLAKSDVDRRSDVYSASVVLWEALTSERLFRAEEVPMLVYAIINEKLRKPSDVVPGLPKGFDEVVMRGLDRDPARRFASAHELAEALEKVMPPAPTREIGGWVTKTAGEALAHRRDLVQRMESDRSSRPPLRLETPSKNIDISSGIVPADVRARTRQLAEPVIEKEHEEPLASEANEIVFESGHPDPIRLTAPSIVDESAQITLRTRLNHAAWLLAAVLLVGGIVAFLVRWSQLANEGADTTAQPSESSTAKSEPAITIGERQRGTSGARSTSTTPSSTAPGRTVVPPTAIDPSNDKR